MANIKFNVGFDVDKSSLSQIKSEIAQLNKSLTERSKKSGFTEEMKEALKYTQLLDSALSKASNNKLDKLNTKDFTNELKRSNLSLSDMYATLKRAGIDGSQAIHRLNNAINSTGIEVRKTSTLLDDMFDTFGKTVKWGIASSAMNQITGSIQRAVGFTKALDESLSHIRVVSEQNAAQMEVFAKNANQAAKELGKTTTEYADASLLFFQQGKNAAEVQELTKATLMGANITGTEVSAMADMITSALNGYSWSADKAIKVTDTLAAIGAATGSDFEELATGMSKVASQAATVGVPFEKLNAMLATISETTREAPETIGTSLKTVFARMSEIKLSGSATDEDGVTMSLGRVQDALSLIDVSLQDTQGNMKDMATVIEEIGGKWSGLNVETKSAITNAMAGQRQASRLMALFNQWDRYEVALNEAMNATGATMEQNQVRMDSMSYKTQQMRAELERLWMNMLDSDVLKGGVDILNNVLGTINNVIESVGGMKTIFLGLGAVIFNVFSKQISGSFKDFQGGLKNFRNKFADKFSTPMTDKEREQAKEQTVKSGLGDEAHKDYQAQKRKLNGLNLELETQKKLKALEEERNKLLQESAKGGAIDIETQKAKKEQMIAEQKKKTLSVLHEIREEYVMMSQDEETQEDYLKSLTSEQVKALGITRKQLSEIGTNFDEIEDHIKNFDQYSEHGLFKDIDKEIENIEALEKQLEDTNKQLEQSSKAIQEMTVEEEQLGKAAASQEGAVLDIETRAKGALDADKIAKGIGSAMGAVAFAMPLISAFGDETLSTSEKLDTMGDALIGVSGSLLMSGNPIAMVAGAIAGLGGILAKAWKETLAYEKAVERNKGVIERYTTRTRELKGEIESLTSTNQSLVDIQREISLVGGDLNKLTLEQKEKYRDLANQIAETTPEMVAYYDSEGNAILKTNASLDSYIEKKKEALKLEQEIMSANKDSFVLEYATDQKTMETKLEAEKKKAEKLENELDDLRSSGASNKRITKKSDELQSSLAYIDDLKNKISNVGNNIQTNIINPFMQSNEAVLKVDDSVKQMVASIYELEDVQKTMDETMKKFEFKSIVGKDGKITKKKRSDEEIAQITEEELDKLETRAENVASALNKIKLGTAQTGEIGKGFRDIYNAISSADQATQAYLGTAASFGLSAEGSYQIISKLAGSINEFGLIPPVALQDIVPVATEESRKQVESTTAELKRLQDQQQALQDQASGITNKYETTTTGIYQQGGMQQTQKYTPEYQAISDKIAENEKAIEQASLAQGQAQAQYNSVLEGTLGIQYELTREYDKYLFSISSTPEGMNKIINTYNQMYEATRLLQEKMNEPTTQTVEVAGEVDPETGLMGDPTQIEVTTFADSSLGKFFYEFESILANIDSEMLPNLGQHVMDTADAVSGSVSQIGQVGEEIDKVYKEMQNKIVSLPDGALDNVRGLNKDIVNEAKKGTQSAIKAVVKAVNAQEQELGKLYATMNKDNIHYFQSVKTQNEAQMKYIGFATGVMGSEYATYAEYKVALDKWMEENSSWLADEQISNAFWAAAQGIEAKRQEGTLTEQIGDQMNIAADQDAAARSAMAQAAAWASTLAEAKASRERALILQQSLAGIDTSRMNKDLSRAARQIIDQKKAETEADLAMYDAMISTLEGKMEEYAKYSPQGSGGGTTGNLNLNLTTGGGNVPNVSVPPPKQPPSGPRPDSSGGDKGGDKGGGDKEQEVEDLEWEKDIYHDINIQLEQKQTLLDKLQKQQDKLYGKELLDNLTQQENLLKQQQALYEKKLEMQKQDLANQKNLLSKQGVQFNVDGTIANYNQLLEEKVKYVNSLSGEAKEAAKEEFQKLVDAMEAYEDMMMNSIVETENAIQDAIDKQREIFLQKYEYAIQLKIEISEDFSKAVDFVKEMNDEFEDMSENYDRTKSQIAEQLDLIERLGIKLEDINQNNANLTEKERLELLEKYNEELQSAIKDLKKLDEELTKIFKDTLKDGLDIVKEHLDEYKNINDQLKHFEQTLKLIGEGDNFAVLDDIYEQQYANITGQIGVLNSQMSSLKAQQAALEAAGMKGTEEWKAVDDAIKQTQKDLNSLAQESLKLLQTEFKNSVSEILDTLDKSMSGGLGLDELKKQQEEIKEERKKYLDGEEKLLAVSKLQQKVQKELETTTDPKKKEQLQKFMDSELAKLKEKDKLTKYDVDRANLIYDLTMKQMALEDQRATKNIMRLVRDTQGNWVYEFTEDAKAIEKAQEDVSSAMEKLMELDKKNLEDTQDYMMKLQEEYYKEVQKIANDAANGKYATEAELRAALEAVNTKYNEKMVEANASYEEAKMNATLSSLAVVLETYKTNGDTLGTLTEQQEALLDAMAQATGDSYLDMADLVTDLISGDEDSIQAAMKELGFTTAEEMANASSAIDSLIKGMTDNWGLSVSDMVSDFIGAGGFKESSTGAIDSIMDKWKEYQDKVQDVKDSTGLNIKDIVDKIGDAGDATDDLNDKTKELIDTFKDEMDAVIALTTSYQKNREEIQANIDKMVAYVDQINKVIDAIKRKNDTESEANKPKPPTTPAPTPTPPPAPAPTPPPNNKPSFSSGEAVRLGSQSKFYSISNLTGSWGWAYPGTKYLIDNPSQYPPMKGYEGNIHISNASGGDLGWLPKSLLQKFDTGGYTGAWGNEGKVAMLHEKEMVLNKEDTQRMLDAVKLVRGVSGSAIDGIARAIMETSRQTLAMLNILVSPHSNNPLGRNGEIQQTVNINADFSGVKNSDEIEKAFENMANMASQYVNRR